MCMTMLCMRYVGVKWSVVVNVAHIFYFCFAFFFENLVVTV